MVLSGPKVGGPPPDSRGRTRAGVTVVVLSSAAAKATTATSTATAPRPAPSTAGIIVSLRGELVVWPRRSARNFEEEEGDGEGGNKQNKT